MTAQAHFPEPERAGRGGAPVMPTSRCLSGQDTTWTPLFTGALARQAGAVVRAIAAEIQAGLAGYPPPADAGSAADDAALAGGRAGFAILYAYLALAGLEDHADAAASALLEEAVETLAQVEMLPSLYIGFPGVAWAAAHLGQEASADDAAHEEIDAALRDYLMQSPWTEPYDLVSGLVGIGVYALERLPSRSAHELLGLVLARLDDSATHTPAGITWLSTSTLLPDSQRQSYPQGVYNCGVAHGVPGVIGLLGRIQAHGIAPGQTPRLLHGAVQWLLAQRLPARAASVFPHWVGPGVAVSPARSAWCYGDPGIAATLLCAAQGAGNLQWQHQALEIARRAAARPAEQAGLRDAGLCHGAAGLGHLFNRMYQATGALELQEAAHFWLRRTLEMRQPGSGVAGFTVYRPPGDTTLGWMDHAGFLLGAAGIALALLAAITPIEPAWDRLLLASCTPMGQVAH